MGARTNEIALVLCLLVLAGAIAAASERLVPPAFGVRIEVAGVSSNGIGSAPSLNSTSGTLVVVVTSSLAFGQLFTTSPVANASVSVVPEDRAPLTPATYTTDSSGELQLMLPSINYSVSIFDLPMNVSVPLQVHQNEITELQLTITGNNYQEVFLDVPANQSGVVPAWAHGTMEVGSSVALLGSNAAFLDLYYASGSAPVSQQTGQRELQTPLLVTGSDVRSNASVSDEWIAFQPETPIALSGLTSIELSVFGAYANVTTYGGTDVGGISGGN
jgi:hypothetical protein